jgi:hypothetical protein
MSATFQYEFPIYRNMKSETTHLEKLNVLKCTLLVLS